MPKKKERKLGGSGTVIITGVLLIIIALLVYVGWQRIQEQPYTSAILPMGQTAIETPKHTFTIDVEQSIISGALSSLHRDDDTGPSRSLSGKALDLTIPTGEHVNGYLVKSTISPSEHSLLLGAHCTDGEVNMPFSAPLYVGGMENQSQLTLAGGGTLFTPTPISTHNNDAGDILRSGELAGQLIYIDADTASSIDAADLETPMITTGEKTTEFTSVLQAPLNLFTQAEEELVIEFNKFNINGTRATDEMTVDVWSTTGEHIAQRLIEDDGVQNGKGKRTTQQIALHIPVPNTGVYRVEMSSNNAANTRIKNLSLNAGVAVLSNFTIRDSGTFYTQTTAARSLQLAIENRTEVAVTNLETNEETITIFDTQQTGETAILPLEIGTYSITTDNSVSFHNGYLTEQQEHFFSPFIVERTTDPTQAGALFTSLQITKESSGNIALTLPVNCTPVANEQGTTDITIDAVPEPTLKTEPEADLISERYTLYANLCGAYLYSNKALDLTSKVAKDDCTDVGIGTEAIAERLRNILPAGEEALNYSKHHLFQDLITKTENESQDETQTIDAKLKGAVDTAILVEGGLDIAFDLIDLNRHVGSDDVLAELTDTNGHVVYSKTIPGDASDVNTGIESPARHHNISVPDLSGLYFFSLSELPYGRSDNDFIVDQLSFNTNRVVLTDTVRIYESTLTAAIAQPGGIETPSVRVASGTGITDETFVTIGGTSIDNQTSKMAFHELLSRGPAELQVENTSITINSAEIYPFSPEQFEYEYFNPGTNFLISDHNIGWLIDMQELSFAIK